MTLAPPIFRNFHAAPAFVGWLLLAASVIVTLAVFSASRANLDGIILGVGAVPCALAILLIAEAERGRPGRRLGIGLATVLAALVMIGWSAFLAWEHAENFPGLEARFFAVEFVPFAATGILLALAGIEWTKVFSERVLLIAGTVTGTALAAASIVAALAFARTGGNSQGGSAEIALAAFTVPFAFSAVVIVSALRHSNGLKRFPYLPLAGFALIVLIAISSAIWSAGTAEHRVLGDYFGTPPPPPDATMGERFYAFSQLAMFPVVLGTLVLLSGRHWRGATVAATVVLLLAIGFAAWSVTDPAGVPTPNFSDWKGIASSGNQFWQFATVLITPLAALALAMSRANASEKAEGQDVSRGG